MKKMLASLLATSALTVATLISAQSIQAQAAETIRFATEATYPPFEFVGEDNQLEGFDIDLAKAICNELKAECTFSNQSFDSLIPSLKFRRFDAVISGMDITPDRLKQVDFSGPYYENSAIFVTEKNKGLTSIEALKGHSVGVQNGSTHQQYLIEKLESQGVKVRPYDTFQNAFLDMTSGRVDTVFADTAVAREWMKERGKGQYVQAGPEVKDADYFGIGYGIAVRKQDKLKEEIDSALKKLKENGTYQKIYDKYFNKA
ncbi:lysine/arginine/ornithine ABC transporter substrate-binding protein [Endozoicomonas sp. 8E]|uniref:lysine/arginine/ornithine ABC transporter substrate-binding protein n=1 Tax=Endozoicomonas sp. 8E TaxID=3035692 RepID=UPI002938E3DF|nr:lysine/arginine/ornithine ABC transporter substrate-binding protein [Endozoicomonas sp. 8E]WOG29484.1 lysine/arginine/ornithine ABC transporter substrate-binding protein [Endozoicomonas sp. 8E]